ncbi:unnamed protein product [Zymoseptoria tritici ST99CH_1A5]|uniref:Secreted protein n=2 Tax=Zymoseptoria tritici TaxID=1047171 RepID=F9XAP6_ZYMTI|nr:uncharacterized protein MYCGRDRAFT_92998 [Zymoseptoria tritici IPO323]EGP87037.1 hypothetical protein MYCGRDRAFT_92998 [Zymoseptoria tritici IPO323]SMY24193.1 unnamed protein product [Zymoseptoria tritici ST99CH_1A5]
MHALSIFTLAAFALGASALGIEQREETHLETRALPPCAQCPNNDGWWLSQFRPDNPGPPEDQAAMYDPGWLPRAAFTKGYVCYALGPGVSFSSGGLRPPYGHWQRRDDTQVMCWHYWQSTLQFVGAGMTVNSYPAHCTVWILTKGSTARVRVEGVNGAQPQYLPEGNKVEGCYGSYQNTDVGLISIWRG